MFFTIPTLMTWTRIVAIPLIVGVFYLPIEIPTQDRKSTRLNSSHSQQSRMPSSA